MRRTDEKWAMLRVPRALLDALAVLRDRREEARQSGHPTSHQGDAAEPLWRVVEMLLVAYQRHGERRERSAARRRVARREGKGGES